MSISGTVKTLIRGNMPLSRIAAGIISNALYNADKENNDKILDNYLPQELRHNKAYIRKLKKDLALARIRHRMLTDEYFLYDFEKLSEAGRHEFLSVANTTRVFRDLQAPGAQELFRDKYATYRIFSDYYKREVIPISGEEDYPAFCDFISRHPKFIAKPRSDYGGHGIFIDSADKSNSREKFRKLLTEKGSVVEELVMQDERMAKFHPQSINTIRVATYLKDGKVTVLESCLRMGVGDAVVDNATSGGICAGVDFESGVVDGKAHLVHGGKKTVIFHPDTHTQILGAQIPCWDELKALVAKLPFVYEKQPLIGWDFALSENGWVMIEANTRPEVQGGEERGMRKAVEDALGFEIK